MRPACLHFGFRKKKVMNTDIKYLSAVTIIKRLAQQGFQAYFAGGFVRDMLLGLPDKGDIDIATNAAPRATVGSR